jgi:hypothetical protein
MAVANPLRKPVPGAWMRSNGVPSPVYVPFEPMTRKNEHTGKDEITGYAPGAHIKRLLTEGWMYTNGPDSVIPDQSPELANTEAALRAELDQAKAERDQFMREMQELRAKLASDAGVPNASKRK